MFDAARNPRLNLIALDVKHAGGRLHLVGGTVRDHLMGRPSKDIDCEVFGVHAGRLETLLRQHGEVNCVGASFNVLKLDDMDFSIPRRDSKSGEGHRGFTITGDPFMSFEDAARRRDFTINAISYDLLNRRYIDPFGGMQDIADRNLRVVDPARFGDDSLRVLRACQFLARFDDFQMDAASMALCRDIDLADLPAERVWGEFDKLLRAPRPSVGLELARRLGVLYLWPELLSLINIPQDPEWHPEGDVWTHTLQVVDAARAALTADPLPAPLDTTVMLAALCHDFGKPSTTKMERPESGCGCLRWRSLGHEGMGVQPTLNFLDRLNIHTIDGYDVRAQVVAIVERHLMPFEFFKSDPGHSAFRRLSRHVDLLLLARVAEADTRGRAPKLPNDEAVAWFRNKVATLDLRDGPPPSILMGRHLLELGMKPGPAIGKLIAAVYERQLDGLVTNLDTALTVAKELMTDFRRVDGVMVPKDPGSIACDWKLRGL